MLKSRLLHFITLLTALFVAVGCEVDSSNGATVPSSGKYGTLQLGEESIPINLVRVSNSDDWILVVISPLTDASNLTTNAVIGLNKAFLGENIDVEYRYCLEDYMLVYEDPVFYYAPFRALQSGNILMSISGNKVKVDVDVILYDGTPFRYSNNNIPLQ
uniref:hypothetical protein n=1 Tax=Alistipes sp. TaxID=1872444 RepID=UPI00405710D0